MWVRDGGGRGESGEAAYFPRLCWVQDPAQSRKQPQGVEPMAPASRGLQVGRQGWNT